MHKDDPAFPFPFGVPYKPCPGMSVRYEFTKAAMKGILAAAPNRFNTPETVAAWAVIQADAALAELERTK